MVNQPLFFINLTNFFLIFFYRDKEKFFTQTRMRKKRIDWLVLQDIKVQQCTCKVVNKCTCHLYWLILDMMYYCNVFVVKI